ncbi:MAG: hypothetical protein FJX61_06335 [Alphaproteobacteria bacterium]|nr:hypothetical protein [Alphaproteobacteria bacterium]
MRVGTGVRLVAADLLAAATSGCMGAIVGAPLLDHAITATSAIMTASSGKGVAEHALDAATGKDCRILESALRQDRKLCETRGAPATAKDFRGLDSLGALGIDTARRGDAGPPRSPDDPPEQRPPTTAVAMTPAVAATPIW